jgi:hypothetical protein
MNAMADRIHPPTGFPMSEVACVRCFFFKPGWEGMTNPKPSVDLDSLVYGECWRFPKRAARRPGDWCGEFCKQGEGP